MITSEKPIGIHTMQWINDLIIHFDQSIAVVNCRRSYCDFFRVEFDTKISSFTHIRNSCVRQSSSRRLCVAVLCRVCLYVLVLRPENIKVLKVSADRLS